MGCPSLKDEAYVVCSCEEECTYVGYTTFTSTIFHIRIYMLVILSI